MGGCERGIRHHIETPLTPKGGDEDPGRQDQGRKLRGALPANFSQKPLPHPKPARLPPGETAGRQPPTKRTDADCQANPRRLVLPDAKPDCSQQTGKTPPRQFPKRLCGPSTGRYGTARPYAGPPRDVTAPPEIMARKLERQGKRVFDLGLCVHVLFLSEEVDRFRTLTLHAEAVSPPIPSGPC